VKKIRKIQILLRNEQQRKKVTRRMIGTAVHHGGDDYMKGDSRIFYGPRLWPIFKIAASIALQSLGVTKTKLEHPDFSKVNQCSELRDPKIAVPNLHRIPSVPNLKATSSILRVEM